MKAGIVDQKAMTTISRVATSLLFYAWLAHSVFMEMTARLLPASIHKDITVRYDRLICDTTLW